MKLLFARNARQLADRHKHSKAAANNLGFHPVSACVVTLSDTLCIYTCMQSHAQQQQ